MNVSKYANLCESMQPIDLDRFFPLEQQRLYVSVMMRRGGLTRRRAEYFVRLWAYLLLKQSQGNAQQLQPLLQLVPLEDWVACTHREASELFYGNQDRGSDRAAGMMIDRLAILGLLEKQFDGQSLSLQIRPIPEMAPAIAECPPEPVKLIADQFNPRTDTIPSANLLVQSCGELVKDTATTFQKIKGILRAWATQYPKGMRVLRRSDNANVVAVYALFPVASESEGFFSQPPSKSFYLTTESDTDPFKMAALGAPDCFAAYIRLWAINTAYIRSESIYLMLEDTRQTVVQMQADFPNLCDIYTLIIHPMHEQLRIAVGFQKTFQDTQRPHSWGYLALDNYVETDIRKVVNSLKPSLDTDKPWPMRN
ncbi:MAG TPA: hypothetical protein V6D18_02985 [Thermosynechococcaceae cyanobacterium]